MRTISTNLFVIRMLRPEEALLGSASVLSLQGTALEKSYCGKLGQECLGRDNHTHGGTREEHTKQHWKPSVAHRMTFPSLV